MAGVSHQLLASLQPSPCPDGEARSPGMGEGKRHSLASPRVQTGVTHITQRELAIAIYLRLHRGSQQSVLLISIKRSWRKCGAKNRERESGSKLSGTRDRKMPQQVEVAAGKSGISSSGEKKKGCFMA